MKAPMLIPAAALAIATTAHAGVLVDVTIEGFVEFNQIGAPPLSGFMQGAPVTSTFQVDSDLFEDSMNFPTRGYEIDQASYVTSSGMAMVGLADPFPMDETPYFVIRNDDPAVDGFFTATSLDFPSGVPLNQEGIFETFRESFRVTYEGDTLDSLDILGAVGEYDFDGLTVFGWSILDGPFDAAFFVFDRMTISAQMADVHVDIKPGSCPNPFNTKSKGRLPVAILGTKDFDVTMVDPDSILIARADGIGGAVAPIWSRIGDAGTPYMMDDPCGCHELDGDGIDDLKLKFQGNEMTDAMELKGMGGGTAIELAVTGTLMDGTPFSGSDCITLVPVGGMGGGM